MGRTLAVELLHNKPEDEKAQIKELESSLQTMAQKQAQMDTRMLEMAAMLQSIAAAVEARPGTTAGGRPKPPVPRPTEVSRSPSRGQPSGSLADINEGGRGVDPGTTVAGRSTPLSTGVVRSLTPSQLYPEDDEVAAITGDK